MQQACDQGSSASCYRLGIMYNEGKGVSQNSQVDVRHEAKLLVGKVESTLGKIVKDCGDCPEMVVIPAGGFEMGSGDGSPYEQPAHRVSIRGFAMGKTEVTRGQFSGFLLATGYRSEGFCWTTNEKGTKKIPINTWYKLNVEQRDAYFYPMTCVSWKAAQAYVRWLSGKTGKSYRLPSEAEWEYACRAGGSHDYCGSDDPSDVAWFKGNSNRAAHPVATRRPNAFGLFDMSGNVLEWTQDCFNDSYKGVPLDGQAWITGDPLACGYSPARGGYFGASASEMQSWRRFDTPREADGQDIVGFRVARDLP